RRRGPSDRGYMFLGPGRPTDAGRLPRSPRKTGTVTKLRSRIAFVVNGDEESAMAVRAAEFATRLSEEFESSFVYRDGGKGRAAIRMLRRLRRIRPGVCFVFGLAPHGGRGGGRF